MTNHQKVDMTLMINELISKLNVNGKIVKHQKNQQVTYILDAV